MRLLLLLGLLLLLLRRLLRLLPLLRARLLRLFADARLVGLVLRRLPVLGTQCAVQP